MEVIRTIKYNPAFLSQEELIQSFVVRNTDLNLILETIQENREQANQHLLVVGARGTGKTTLALRVAAEVRKNGEFSKLWYPIVFSEESYDVCSPGEFWLEALFHIGKHTKDKRWKKAHQELRLEMDESRLRDRALAQIMDFADEQDKRLLLIVENLNMILGQQISQDAAWEIRHTLINEPRIMLYGTATNRFEQIENGEKAMFELFKIHELQPLNSDECRTLWESITGQELKGDRIRPVQILTGGSPRLLVIISVFAAKASFNELMLDLTHLVDEHTEYFKSHIDNLPPLERKVFVTLADLWQPSTAREVGQAARMDVNKTSAYLKRLISKGAVMEVEQESGKKWYQLAERMYNIYHLMRRRGEPSSRVRAVVDFMVNFYSDEDLVKTVSAIAEEACGIDLESRSDHYQALVELLKNPKVDKHRQKIINTFPKMFFKSPNLPDPLKKLTSIDTASPVKSIIFSEEELSSVRPFNSDDSNVWFDLGIELEKKEERLDDAEKAYRESVKIDPNSWKAVGKLALLLERKGDYLEAKELCEKFIDINPDDYWIWALYGIILMFDLKQYEEAEKALRRAIDANPDIGFTWSNLGFLLSKYLNRYEESEQVYYKALDIDSTFIGCWISLVSLQMNELHTPEKALQTAETAIEKSDRSPEMLNALAITFYQNQWSDYLDSAETWCREAIEKEEGNKGYVLTLSYILGVMNRWDEAIALSTEFLQNKEFVSENNRNITSFIISSAAKGYAPESLKIIEQSNVRKIMEPLITGLKLFLGEKVRAPQEVMEIGKDVVKRIKEKMEEQSKKFNK